MIGQTLYLFLEILFFGLRGGIFLVFVYFVYDFLKILVVFFVGMFVDFDIECLGHILYYFLLFCFGVVYVPLICFVCFGQILYAFLKIIVFRICFAIFRAYCVSMRCVGMCPYAKGKYVLVYLPNGDPAVAIRL